ncbi:hypothetical protein EI16_08425 [Hydrogenovibrio marinus]|uniref:Spermatogenesis-associated protein 20-like TRX domain-containing protein n=2 Tax=Hydrogenovibrio marinus TaxID=28885 RepID=A0A066ZR72_HYDMR|nr:hypothetical protein EI16_08425 [Hydrogenovibrio marinus]
MMARGSLPHAIKHLFTCFALLTSIFAQPSQASELSSHLNSNQLYNNPSPYLAMHASDPVHWQTWQASILQQAQKSNKIIMISSGYFSCHWCHVMQRENYRNPQVATYLNQHFISVKIDRELMPDLDRYLIEFAHKASGHAGWPEHVFLTPQGYPFFALTYQPHQQFINTLKRIQTLWQTDPTKIISAAKQAIADDAHATDAKQISWQQFKQNFFLTLSNQEDVLGGGLKTENKFPKAPLLLSLLNDSNLPEEQQDWLELTLTQMQQQQLQDHINGGFFRYTIDPEWQTPHFEKMLYTQALLAKAYFIAAKRFERKDFLQTAKATLAYAEKHLYNPKTQLFLSSESAIDRQGIEGGDYLWTQTALQKALNPTQYQQVVKDWQLNQPAPFTIKNGTPGWLPKPTHQNWQAIQAKLMRPINNIPTDSKNILGWNGLMLSAYAEAVETTPNNQDYHQQASQLAKRLMDAFNQNAGQKISTPRAYSKDNQPMGTATIQDYAFVFQGLRDWQNATHNSTITNTLQKLSKQANTRFFTAKGWLYTSAPLLPGQVGDWAIPDGALPSPTAIFDCTQPGRFSQLGSQATSQLSTSPLDYASYLTCRNNTD